MIITWENYEEYMMMHADGELQPAEVQALMTFINEHSQLKSELAAYERVHIVADISVAYTEKASLLKPVPARRVVLITWQRYAIAAGVAALLFFSVYKFRENNSIVENYAAVRHDSVMHGVIPAIQHEALPVVKEQLVSVREEEKEIQTTVKQQQVAHNAMALASAHKPGRRPAYIAPEVTPAPPAVTTQSIDQLPVAQVNEMKIKPIADVVIAAEDVPGYTIGNTATERSFWDKLPLDESNKNELKTMQQVGATIANAYDKVNSVKEEIKNTTISLKIEHRKLIVSF